MVFFIKKCTLHNEFYPNKSEWLPCTEEYFYKNTKNKGDGLCPECKECSKDKSMRWKKENPEKVKLSMSKTNSKPDRQKVIRKSNDIRRISGKVKLYAQTHKEKINQYSKFRQMHKSHNISKDEISELYEYANSSCMYCGMT